MVLKKLAKSILAIKPLNDLASSISRQSGAKVLGYKIQRSGGFLPDLVDIDLPGTDFRRSTMTLWCRHGKEQMARAAAAGGWAAPERPTPELMFALFSPEETFFDVGANSGYYSLLAMKKKKRPAAVVAFEPSSDALGYLRRNLALNPGDTDALEICTKAVSHESGVAQLFYPVDTHGLLETSQTLVKDHKGRESFEKIETVETISIDDFCSQHSGLAPVGVMKVDVEGHEEAVFRGSTHCLATDRPFVFLEVLPEDDPRVTEGIMRERDYRFFAFSSRGVVETPNLAPTREHRNRLAVPAEKIPRLAECCKKAGLSLSSSDGQE